jgi:hypothetical protein
LGAFIFGGQPLQRLSQICLATEYAKRRKQGHEEKIRERSDQAIADAMNNPQKI